MRTISSAGLHISQSGPPGAPVHLFSQGLLLSGRMWLPQVGILTEFRCLGHVWNLQNPDLFAEVVRRWLTGQALPDGSVACS